MGRNLELFGVLVLSKMKYFALVLLATLAHAAPRSGSSEPWPDVDDPCYQMEKTCEIPGSLENQIGNIPWMPSIEVCENACRTEPGCTWFSWKQLPSFRMCYLYTECPCASPMEGSIAADITQCMDGTPAP